jgi:hypothetical protein
MPFNPHLVALSAACLISIGCGSSSPSVELKRQTAATDDAPPSTAHLLAAAPENSVNVADAREETEDDAEIALRGRVGGDENPFVDGMAAFTIVDMKCKPCEEDGCKTPWDYCCSPELASHKALVKIVDGNGEVVGRDARKLLGIKELSTVVVHGRAKRDDAGNLTVLADKVFIEE